MNIRIAICTHGKVRACIPTEDFTPYDQRIWNARGWGSDVVHRPIAPDPACFECNEQPEIRVWRYYDAPSWLRMQGNGKGWIIIARHRALVEILAEQLSKVWNITEVLDRSERHYLAITD